MIVDRPLTPVLRLTRFPCPDEFGRMRSLDALLVEFDYGGAIVPFDDDRQFIRIDDPGGPVFARRDRTGEAAVVDAVRRDGLVQMRVGTGQAAKGRMVFAFRGRDAAEFWQDFLTERVPALQARGWQNQIDSAFGPRLVGSVGQCDMRVADAPDGKFSLDLGIEIDGSRHPLLPILLRLRERGGIAAARIIDGEVITSLVDGRILRLPEERITRLLAVMDDLIASACRINGEALELESGEAPAVLDLEDLVTTRWQDGAAIAAHVARFRNVADIPDVKVPPSFTASLRPYQQQGVNWLQHLREDGLGGLLADDMGLGKTAQTIAHIAIEEAAGRMDRPALVVVPTSLVPNWTAELARFAPHLRVVVLHGLDRHQRRSALAGVHIVITTYAVLARDIEAMTQLAWHLVVLDEAQAIKSPTAKATHAVCRLDTRHRLCLSGTPIENNLGEFAIRFSDAGAARITEELHTPFPHTDREGRRPGPSPPARDAHPAIHRAAHEGGGGDRAAAEAHHPAPNYARTGAARAVRDDPRHTAREGGPGDRHQRSGAKPCRRSGRTAEAAAGLLRPAAGEVAIGAPWRKVEQARGLAGDGRGDDRGRPTHPAFLAIHLDARSDETGAQS